MNREILFRGHRTDGEGWLRGTPIENHVGTFIVYDDNPHYCSQYGYMEIDELAPVEPETVGQYTGMKDSAGKKIFEGDILLLPEFSIGDELIPEAQATVVWGNGGWELMETEAPAGTSVLDQESAAEFKIIGNIWDNPELEKEASE